MTVCDIKNCRRCTDHLQPVLVMGVLPAQSASPKPAGSGFPRPPATCQRARAFQRPSCLNRRGLRRAAPRLELLKWPAESRLSCGCSGSRPFIADSSSTCVTTVHEAVDMRAGPSTPMHAAYRILVLLCCSACSSATDAPYCKTAPWLVDAFLAAMARSHVPNRPAGGAFPPAPHPTVRDACSMTISVSSALPFHDHRSRTLHLVSEAPRQPCSPPSAWQQPDQGGMRTSMKRGHKDGCGLQQRCSRSVYTSTQAAPRQTAPWLR